MVLFVAGGTIWATRIAMQPPATSSVGGHHGYDGPAALLLHLDEIGVRATI